MTAPLRLKEIAQRTTRTVWLNVYRDEVNGLSCSLPYFSRQAADASAGTDRVGIDSVEISNNIETGEVEG